MQEQSTTGTLLFTTEDRYGKTGLFAGYLFLGFLAAVVAAVPLWSWEGRFEYETSGVIVMFLFGLIFFISMVVGVFFQRGTWRFDDEGVTWEPLRRKPRHIRWEDVSRIKWAPKYATLADGNSVTPINWHLWRKRDRLAARYYVEEKLAGSFDLEDPAWGWRYRLSATFEEQHPSDMENGSVS